jgi:hypothetical protein
MTNEVVTLPLAVDCVKFTVTPAASSAVVGLTVIVAVIDVALTYETMPATLSAPERVPVVVGVKPVPVRVITVP